MLGFRGAAVDVKNKKGNSPLWLACNGGHLDVVQLLVNAHADVDSQDNRKVSCLMAAFRKGHVKVIKWLVKHVTQFPSDQECMRYIATIGDNVSIDLYFNSYCFSLQQSKSIGMVSGRNFDLEFI